MFSIEINNEVYRVPSAETIIQSCYRIGIEIPRFCYHERLSIAGNCRMCLVEVAYPKVAKPVASCAFPVTDNMKIFTNTALVKKARESVLEFLLANHPLDCPICDQGGECDLQDETMIFGSDRGRFYELKRAVSDKECGPLIKTVMTRCIHCTRCIRYSSEIAGLEFLGALGRGSSMEIGTYVENLIDSEVSGNVIDLCPVGALTSKPYAFTARPWELRSIQTVDVLDSFCSSIRVDVRGSEIVRILPLMHSQNNEEWISDRTRFFYDGLRRQRLHVPYVRFKDSHIPLSWEKAFTILSSVFYYYTFFFNRTKVDNTHRTLNFLNFNSNFGQLYSSRLFGILGKLVDIETCFIFKSFLESCGSCNFFTNIYNNSSLDFRFEYLPNFFYQDKKGYDLLTSSDICLLVNFNPRLELPIFNIKLRRNSVDRGLLILSLGASNNLNYFSIHLGNSSSVLKSLLEGRNFFCRKLVSSQRPMIFVNNNNNILRSDFSFFSKAFSSLFKYLNLKNNKWFGLHFFSLDTTSIARCELGFFANQFSSNIASSNASVFYFLNSEYAPIFKDLSLSNFLIYQGHHGDDLALLSDIVLPSSSFIESSNHFMDFQGFMKRTKSVLPIPGMARENWQIFVSLYVFLFENFLNTTEKIPLFFNGSILSVRQQILKFIPYFFEWISPSSHYFYDEQFLCYSSKTPFFLNNSFFQSDSFFHYMSDPITRSSQILALCTQRFVISKNNFFE